MSGRGTASQEPAGGRLLDRVHESFARGVPGLVVEPVVLVLAVAVGVWLTSNPSHTGVVGKPTEAQDRHRATRCWSTVARRAGAGRDCVLIAGGSGITPVLSVRRTAAEEDDARRFVVLYFIRDASQAALRQELEELRSRERVEVVRIPSQPPEGWRGPQGRLDRTLLASLLPEYRRRWSYFVCGPPTMTDAATRGSRADETS